MRTLFHILLFLPIVAFSQGVPQGISYQAVAYDSEGYEISNQDISVRLGILLGGVDAEASYTEVHSVTTDDFGLFSLVISEGVSYDDFSSIIWEEGAYLKVEVDEDLDGEYSVMGVSSFNAVPYALSAPTSDDILIRINEIESLLDSIYLYGCTDSLACNYDYTKQYDDSTCQYARDGFDCDGYVIAEIGDEFEGGILFYIDSTRKHGLVAANFDVGSYSWGCIDESISGPNNQAIGFGKINTLEIVSGCDESPIAATRCLAYMNDEFIDWYLPSFDELTLLFNSIGMGSPIGNIGGFISDYYWSSSEENANKAWQIYFGTGNSFGYPKDAEHSVRPIRSF